MNDMRKESRMNKKKVNQYIRQYLTDFKSAKVDKWNYEDGCVLLGAIQIYSVTKETFLKDFVIHYLEKYITESGDILFYEKEDFNIDNISTGRALFFAYGQTQNEKYKKAILVLADQLKKHPRTKSNHFWHKKIYPYQVWLDCLFMAQPFYMMYETQIGVKENYKDIVNQFQNARKFLYNENEGLYYHGYDEARESLWANKETGCSGNYWLRSMGWLLLAIIDTMEEMSEQIYEYYHALKVLFKEALAGLLSYQDKDSKLFYQVIDKPEYKGNYLETSGSAMVSAAILKACQMRVLLPEKYEQIGVEILEALVDNKLVKKNSKLVLTDTCRIAGLGPGEARDGSVDYYISEPIQDDDHKGAGAFMMAYGQWLSGNQQYKGE